MEKELPVDLEFKELINGCIIGNNKEQSNLYKKYYDIILSVCLKHLNNKCEAEDLTQDIFIKLISKLDKFKGQTFSQLGAWIKTSAKNHTIDFIRSKKPIKSIDKIPDNLFSETIDLSILDNYEDIMANDIKNAISNLPKRYRAVFELYYLSDYSHEEIADELNLCVGTSKSNLFKAKRKLAAALSQYNNKFN